MPGQECDRNSCNCTISNWNPEPAARVTKLRDWGIHKWAPRMYLNRPWEVFVYVRCWYCELVVILCTCLANDCMLKSSGSSWFSLVPNGTSKFLMQNQGLTIALRGSVWDINTLCISSGSLCSLCPCLSVPSESFPHIWRTKRKTFMM